MGIAEAKRYIRELRKRQENPYLWPDFLTGLPEKQAIIKRLAEVYPQIGEYAVAYVRIANVHPYLLKYGPDHHADIIQWAAAILKTSCQRCPKCFVGTISTHDFVIMCETKEMVKHLNAANRLFTRRVAAFYSERDLKNQTVLSFNRDGKRVDIGLIRLVAAVADHPPVSEKSRLLQELGKICEAMEGTGEDIRVIGREPSR